MHGVVIAMSADTQEKKEKERDRERERGGGGDSFSNVYLSNNLIGNKHLFFGCSRVC